MCTVTYLPLGKNNFILTSNRDESPVRETIPPKVYKENGIKLVYPKDKLAGGTWIGMSDKKRLVCLLNGGFEIHQREASYKMSRGVIVKSILISTDFISYINDFDFCGIEPFTIVLVDWNAELITYELVWDGNQKHFSELAQEPKIWSSSTLYSESEKQLREKWFADWLPENKKFEQKEILIFHHNSEIGTSENSLKMKRSNLETVSITSVIKTSKGIIINYNDVVNDMVCVLDNEF